MARTADEHAALRPGTDAAFYNGMLHVIARDGLTDERFIAEHTVGWEEVRDTVAAYTPERVGEICGLDPRQIERVAHLWGRARRCWAAHGAGWSSTSRASRTCSRASTCPWPPARRPGPATAPSPARARPGRPRARPEVRHAAWRA